MPLTREFRNTVQARAKRDAGFRQALLREAIDCFLSGDLGTGKIVLRDLVNATIGFTKLGVAVGRSPKSLMRMLSPAGNPNARTLFEIVAFLQKRERVRLKVRSKHVAA